MSDDDDEDDDDDIEVYQLVDEKKELEQVLENPVSTKYVTICLNFRYRVYFLYLNYE